jgi:hypothetical protein
MASAVLVGTAALQLAWTMPRPLRPDLATRCCGLRNTFCWGSPGTPGRRGKSGREGPGASEALLRSRVSSPLHPAPQALCFQATRGIRCAVGSSALLARHRLTARRFSCESPKRAAIHVVTGRVGLRNGAPEAAAHAPRGCSREAVPFLKHRPSCGHHEACTAAGTQERRQDWLWAWARCI